MNTIAEQIKQMRKKTGLSQKAFGDYIGGASQRTVQDWECGIKEPPAYAFNLICEKFKKDYEES